MKQVSRSALVSFSAEQMFNLVNDVASYPEFLPGCSGSRVIESSSDAMVASVDVAKAGISKTFTTSNELINGEAIIMNLVDGPFKRLNGSWSLTEINENVTSVKFNIDYELKNFFIDKASKLISKTIIENLVNDFKFKVEKI